MNAFYQSQLDRLAREWVGLPDKPDELPENTLAALWLLAQGRPRSLSFASRAALVPLSPAQESSLIDLVSQRLAGAPLAYLTGRQDFMGIEMLVSPGALIPRRETELLAHAIVTVADTTISASDPAAILIDTCTGVGNVAIYCARQFPAVRLFASDLSPEAIVAARANAEFCHTNSICFRSGDLLTPFDTGEFREKVSLISCNPPYISQGKLSSMVAEIAVHEPRAAFDGGPFGISIVSRLVNEAPAYLKAGGWLVFEIGLGQGNPLLRRIERLPCYRSPRTFGDARGEIRVIALQKV